MPNLNLRGGFAPLFRTLSIAACLLAATPGLQAQSRLWIARDGGEMHDPSTSLGRSNQGFRRQTLTTDPAGNIYAVGTVENGSTPDMFLTKIGPDGVRRWSATFDSGDYDYGEALAVDGAGNVLVLGRDRQGVCRLVKYDPSGVEQWHDEVFVQTSSRSPSLALDGSGNAYVAGRSGTQGTVVKIDGSGVRSWTVERPGASFLAAAVAPDGGVYAVGQGTAGGISGILILHYGPDGTELWSWAEAGGDPQDVKVDAAGAVYVTGGRQASSSPSTADVRTLKVDAAGVPQWSATYDAGREEYGFSLALDASGNVFVTGQLDSPTGGDFALLKYSPAGALLWSATYDGSGGFDLSYDVAVDGSGNAFVTGYAAIPPTGAFLTVSYDPAGNQRWIAIQDTGGGDTAYQVEVDANGDVIVAGDSTAPFNLPFDMDLRIVKYDAAGNEQWNVDDGSTANAADLLGDAGVGTRPRKTMVLDAAGNAYLAGTSFNGRNQDVRISRIDSLGVRQWSAVFDGGGDDWATAIATAGDGVVVASRSWNGANYDWRVLAYDGSGTLRWQAAYDAGDLDYPYDVAVDGGGNVYVVGQSRSAGEQNAFRTVKFDSSGALQWAVRPELPRMGIAVVVALDGAGNAIVGGITQSADLGGFDRLIISYDPAGSERWRAVKPNGGNPVLAVDAAGNVAVADPAQSGGFRTARYSPSGAEQWERIHASGAPGTTFDLPLAIALDAGGNVIVTGVGQSFATPATTVIAFQTVKYSASGTELWSALHGTNAGAFALAVDRAGDVYVTGAAWNPKNLDIHTVKYSAAGVERWTAVHDGGGEDNSYAVALDAAGSVYVGGDSVAAATGPDLVVLKLGNEVPFGVYAPNGGESWPIGSSQVLSWSFSDPTGSVRVELSRDGGATYQVLFSSTPNDGQQSWTVTGPATAQARIRVTHRTVPTLTDTSDAPFTIPAATLAVQAPNGGESAILGTSLAITWTSSNLGGNVKIELSRDGGGTWSTLFGNTANDGQQLWTVTGPATTQALIRVTSTANAATADSSDAPFTILDPSLHVAGPNGGETAILGSAFPITWTSANLGGNVRIELSRDGGATWSPLFTSTPNDGLQSWNVEGPATAQALIRVASVFVPAVSDTSDAPFTIPPATLTVQNPSGGTVLIGWSYPITWTSANLGGNVTIELSRDGGATWAALFANTPNDGSQSWNVTGPATPQAMIRITSRIEPSVSGTGQAFGIPPAGLTLQSPNGGNTVPIGRPFPITWSSTDLGGNVVIELSRDDGASWTALFASTPNDGNQTWNVTGPETAQARIRIRSRIEPAVEDASDGAFALQSP